MTKTSNPIVFFGNGPVAAESLRLLLNTFSVEAVVTKAKPAHHKGDAPVTRLCEQHNIPCLAPANKQELTDVMNSANFNSRVGVIIDYGIIVEQAVIDYFPLGIINSHFSLLPEWRGADPITFALLSGQKETGVSLMSIVEKMDEGPLLAQGKLSIERNDNSASLTKKLIRLSHDMLKTSLPLYSAGSIGLKPQQGKPTYSRKLTKQDGQIDWTKPADVLEREIRAYYEWPKSFTRLGSYDIIIREAVVADTTGQPGQYEISKNKLVIYCGEKSLDIKSLQPFGKKEMPVQAFLAGYKF